jgi:hypothetical protein
MASEGNPENPEEKDATAAKQQTEGNNQREVRPTTIKTDRVADAVIDESITPKRESHRDDHEQEFHEKELKWTIRGVIFVFIYTIVTFVQLLFYQCNSVRQLRAYVTTTNIELHCPSCDIPDYEAPKVKAGSLIKDVVIVTLQNGGQTPAYNLSAHLNWQPMPYGSRLPIDYPYKDRDTVGQDNLKPLESHTASNPGKEAPFTFMISVDEVKKAQAGKSMLYFYGHADYRDIYKRNRSTTFCFAYVPDIDKAKGFDVCPDHNEPN